MSITEALVGMIVAVGPAREEVLAEYIDTHTVLGMFWRAESGNVLVGKRDVTGAFVWTVTDILYHCRFCGGYHETH